MVEHAAHRLHHPPTQDSQVLQVRRVAPAPQLADGHGHQTLRLPEEVLVEVLVEVALVPPVQVQLLALWDVQGQQQEGGQVVGHGRGPYLEAPQDQVGLADQLSVVHREVQPLAVEENPPVGDVAPVNPPRNQAGPRGADVFAGREGEGVQGITLGGIELLPDLGEEVEEREEVGLCPVQASVGQPWGCGGKGGAPWPRRRGWPGSG